MGRAPYKFAKEKGWVYTFKCGRAPMFVLQINTLKSVTLLELDKHWNHQPLKLMANNTQQHATAMSMV